MTDTLHAEAKVKAKEAELALRDTWGTPQKLFDELNAEVLALKQARVQRFHEGAVPAHLLPNIGFTLDVCAEAWNTKVPCEMCPDGTVRSMWFGPGSPTGVIDTLTQGNIAGHDWFGNFPFSQLDKWLAWAWRWYSAEARAAGMLPGIGVGIMPATRTEQEEWQKHIEPFRDKEQVAQAMGVRLTTRFITTPTEKSKYGRTKFVPPPGVKPSSPQFGTVTLRWEPL